jgi:hypothetical protein
VRKEYLIYNYGPAAAGDGKSAEPFNKPASVRSSSSDRHWMTASNGKRHNGSGRGNNNNNKMGADQRSKRVSHNGSHHSASMASTGGDFATPSDTPVALDEIDCLAAFHAVYHELQLIRTVRRPRDLLAESPQQSKSSSSGSGNKKKNFHLHPAVDAQPMQTLLFLGNIHSQLEQRASYRPTSYQPALVRHDHQEVSKSVIDLVAR